MLKNKASCLVFLTLFSFSQALKAQQYSRGIGVYPGHPKEFFGPGIRIDAIHYSNLGLHRAAYQPDAYDYDLTAQLIITKPVPLRSARLKLCTVKSQYTDKSIIKFKL